MMTQAEWLDIAVELAGHKQNIELVDYSLGMISEQHVLGCQYLVAVLPLQVRYAPIRQGDPPERAFGLVAACSDDSHLHRQ